MLDFDSASGCCATRTAHPPRLIVPFIAAQTVMTVNILTSISLGPAIAFKTTMPQALAADLRVILSEQGEVSFCIYALHSTWSSLTARMLFFSFQDAWSIYQYSGGLLNEG